MFVMATIDFEPWTRHHDDPAHPIVPFPLRHYYPKSRQEIIEIITAAEAISTKPEVRASGSHWALSQAALTDEFIVETQDPKGDDNDLTLPRLNRTLYEVVPECLNSHALEFFRGQGVTTFVDSAPVDHSKFYLYHVEAGTRIYELYHRLDEVDDIEPRSLANLLAPYKGPWAMQTLGGAGGQTIVGAFSTGTHGGDVKLPVVADAVQAIHLIGPEAREYWLERELKPGLPMVDDAKLEALYPHITINRDPDVFNSVLVSVGRMGIIYSVVLRVVRQYSLHEVRGDKTTWSDVKKWVGNPWDPMFNNRFVQVVVNPNTQRDNKENSAWVTVRNLLPLSAADSDPLGRKERSQNGNAGHSFPLSDPSSGFLDKTAGALFNKICASDTPVRDGVIQLIDEYETARDDALKTAAGLTLLILNPLTPPPLTIVYEKLREAALLAAAAAEAMVLLLNELLAILAPGPLFNTLAVIANWAATNDHMEIFRFCADIGMGFDQGKRDWSAISYAIMDIHNYLDVNCTSWGDSLEVFIDVSTPTGGNNLIDYVDGILQHTSEMANGWLSVDDPALAGKRMGFPGYISLRFMGQTQALIGMQKWSRACSLEIDGVGEAHGTGPYLAAAERDSVVRHGTVHWGQRNDLRMKEVERMWDWIGPGGPLYRWRKTLSKFTHNGRLTTFSTPFTRQRGLEVVEPEIQSFRVIPTEGCAGEEVTVEWNAFDNPPGTVMAVRVVPPDSSTPINVIPLSDLVGSVQVPLPDRRADFQLAATYTLNYRPLTTTRSIGVHGFKDHELWPFILVAECMTINGAARWAARMSFANMVSQYLAVEAIISWFAPSVPAWRVQHAGIPDVSFSPAGLEQLIASQPKLRGDWIFFSEIAGCGGAAPELHVQLRLVCGQ